MQPLRFLEEDQEVTRIVPALHTHVLHTIPEPQNKQNYIQSSKASSFVAVWDNYILLLPKQV